MKYRKSGHIKPYLNNRRLRLYLPIIILTILSCALFTSKTRAAEPLYGHLPYTVIQKSKLVSAGKYRSTGRVVRLEREAAEAFIDMRRDAAKEKVRLMPISGHRTHAYQERLFKRAIKRYGSKQGAAKWVAPPGHSEHHTGLAIDIADGTELRCDVESCFEDSRAFRWLKRNASRYGFELSFTKENGKVSYEPWHWRYTASGRAKELFRK